VRRREGLARDDRIIAPHRPPPEQPDLSEGICCDDSSLIPRYRQVIAVSGKELGIEHSKLRPLITNFEAMEAAIAGLSETVDDAFCALGTTIKTAGSRDAFRHVDFGYVVAFARAARAAGARRLMLVSAIGASMRSAIFYLRVKGEKRSPHSAIPPFTSSDPAFCSATGPSHVHGRRSASRWRLSSIR
jgi:hypothetical protein